MTTDPKALADEIERLVQGEVQRCVLNLTQDEWGTILAALRAPSSAETMREAFKVGFWSCAHMDRQEMTDATEAALWDVWQSARARAALAAHPDPGPAPVEGWTKGAEAMREQCLGACSLIARDGHSRIAEGADFCARVIRELLLPPPPPPAEPSRDAQEEPDPWPAGCIKPGSCGRHEQCMYAMSVEKCRHYGRNLAEDVHAHRKPALAAARQEGGER